MLMTPALFVQQQIFAIRKGFDFDKLYIVCERIVLCNIPHQSIVDSIMWLCCHHFIYLKGKYHRTWGDFKTRPHTV